jgi:hypothetical protein
MHRQPEMKYGGKDSEMMDSARVTCENTGICIFAQSSDGDMGQND